MRILVNGLSATSLSGQYVLLGHLRQLAGWTGGAHEFQVLYHRGNAGLVTDLGRHVTWEEAPGRAGSWTGRLCWELFALNRVARRSGCDVLFTPTGTIVPGFRRPQATLAQNPWCFTRRLHGTARDRVKAALQRAAYRQAVRRADLLLYNSGWMQSAYRDNAGGQVELAGAIAYQGLDEETFAVAAASRDTERRRFEILTVSVMAAWKNIEAVLAAVGLLRQRGLPAELTLVGPWPDARYEAAIRSQAAALRLGEAVRIVGQVSRSDLLAHYARARVFCLLSRCESFGIPALEAQAFGTPAVVSSGCAMPEVLGRGCVAVDPDDGEGAVSSLARLLSEEATWGGMSQAARENAARFRWQECSRPLLRMFELG